MKKIVMLIIGVTLLLSAGTSYAWDHCYKDVNYAPELMITLDAGGVIRGQAVLLGDPGFPAPITGVVSNGRAYFTIAYLGEGGVRFYDIATSGGGDTWGIVNSDGEYYDLPHSATVTSCAAAIADSAVDSGAN